MNYDLRNTVRTWVLPFVLIAAILIGINLLWLVPALQNVRSAASVLALEIADRLRADTNFFLQTTLAELSFVAEDIAHEPERAKLTIQLLMKRQPGFRNVVMLDRTANEIIQIDRYALIKDVKIRDYSKQSYFYLALEGSPNFGTLQVSPELEPFITLAVPVERAGRVVNILVADLSLRPLIAAVSYVKPEQGVAYILDKDGFQIVHPDLTEILKRQNFLSRPIVQKTLVDGEVADGLAGEDFYVNDHHVEAFTVGVPIPIAQLGLFYEQPRSQAFAGERRMIVIAAVTTFIGILALFVMVRSNRRLSAANVRLLELDSVKSEFVSVAAHQLRTPLTGVKWTINTLLEEPQGLTTEQKKILQDAFGAANRLTELINDLLNVARIEEGRFGFAMHLQSLIPVIQDVALRFKKIAADKGIDFSVSLPKEAPEFTFDEEKISMVLENLIDNAMKYTPPSGKVFLTVWIKDDNVVVAVRDTGIGVPREQFHRLFTKFFRSANAQLYQTTGTGLGLYVSKNIIDQHRGKIWLESEEDKGSTFFFSLPIKK